MEMQASDLSARLLATENITVVRSNVRTASFDIQSRILTLPMWKDMTPEIEDMLVGHEVGHARYTGEKYSKPIEENPKLMSYMNILEDVRIEKLIKREYPGLRKRMNEGYKQLNDRDFFGVTKLDVNTLNLIDRINLYFKVGFQCGVKFNQDERNFVNRAERTETIEEVIQLAKEIYAYSKEQAEKEKEQRASKPQEDEEEEETDDIEYTSGHDADADESDHFDDEKPEGVQPSDSDAKEEDEGLESVTERTFQDNLDQLADQSTVYQYHKLEKANIDPIIGFKQVLKDLSFDFSDRYISSYYSDRLYLGRTEALYNQEHLASVNKFKTDSTSSVNYLIKEFEMKKSAQQYKRAQTSKLGSLDMRKVYAYKLKDDLFKRVTVLPTGKNHGMIFMLDWSGSMSDVIYDTLKQVINLAMFCNKAQIPYRVFAFTSQYNESDADRMKRHQHWKDVRGDRLNSTSNESRIDHVGNMNLLELFSDKMSMSEFNTMVKKLLDPRVFWHQGYDLGGTPLNEALVWVYHNIGQYMEDNRIEKMNFITLSDGAGSHLPSSKGYGKFQYNARGDYAKVKHLIRDEYSKKTYAFGDEANLQTETFLKMIKDRYNIRTIGFYICRNTRRALSCAIKDNVYGYVGNFDSAIDAMRKDFKEQGFASVAGTGRDDLFIVPSESTKISEDELTVGADMNSRALARNLGKFLNNKKTSRVLLSRFIEYVA